MFAEMRQVVPWATATQIKRPLARDLMLFSVAFQGAAAADLPTRARRLREICLAVPMGAAISAGLKNLGKFGRNLVDVPRGR